MRTSLQAQSLATLRQVVASALDRPLLPPTSVSAASIASPIASSSRLRLTTPLPSTSSRRTFATVISSATPFTTNHQPPSALGRHSRLPPAATRLLPSPHHRPISTHIPTITSKPDSPEEPNVYQSGDPTILLTDRAIKQLLKIASKEKDKVNRLGLRIAVEPGGCHGYQYKMELEETQSGADQQGPGEEDDFRFQPTAQAISSPSSSSSEILPLPILIDSISLTLLKGSTIDYVTELIGSQFAIKDNPQAKGAGCGCGVSWEPIL